MKPTINSKYTIAFAIEYPTGTAVDDVAIENLYPNAKVNFSQCVSRSIACTVENIGVRVDAKFLKDLEEEMRRLVELDLPIERYSISKAETAEVYNKKGLIKCQILEKPLKRKRESW